MDDGLEGATGRRGDGQERINNEGFERETDRKKKSDEKREGDEETTGKRKRTKDRFEGATGRRTRTYKQRRIREGDGPEETRGTDRNRRSCRSLVSLASFPSPKLLSIDRLDHLDLRVHHAFLPVLRPHALVSIIHSLRSACSSIARIPGCTYVPPPYRSSPSPPRVHHPFGPFCLSLVSLVVHMYVPSCVPRLTGTMECVNDRQDEMNG